MVAKVAVNSIITITSFGIDVNMFHKFDTDHITNNPIVPILNFFNSLLMNNFVMMFAFIIKI